MERGRTGEFGHGTGVPRGSPLCSEQRQHFSLPRRPALPPKHSHSSPPRVTAAGRAGSCEAWAEHLLRGPEGIFEMPRSHADCFAAQPHEQRQMGSGRRDGDKGAQPAPRAHPLALSTAGCLGHPTKHKGSRKQGSASPFGPIMLRASYLSIPELVPEAGRWRGGAGQASARTRHGAGSGAFSSSPKSQHFPPRKRWMPPLRPWEPAPGSSLPGER